MLLCWSGNISKQQQLSHKAEKIFLSTVATFSTEFQTKQCQKEYWRWTLWSRSSHVQALTFKNEKPNLKGTQAQSDWVSRHPRMIQPVPKCGRRRRTPIKRESNTSSSVTGHPLTRSCGSSNIIRAECNWGSDVFILRPKTCKTSKRKTFTWPSSFGVWLGSWVEPQLFRTPLTCVVWSDDSPYIHQSLVKISWRTGNQLIN